MCGIFGLTIKDSSNYSHKQLLKVVNKMFLYSESRGKEASGVAALNGSEMKVLKAPMAASSLINTKDFSNIFDLENKRENDFLPNFFTMGHARLVTNGDMSVNKNNQPVIKHGMVCVHNGIVVNYDTLWNENAELKKTSEVDSEIIVSLLDKYIKKDNSIFTAAREVFSTIKGSASISVSFSDLPYLLLATNNGSLYVASNKNILIFASELYILDKVIKNTFLKEEFDIEQIIHVKANKGKLLHFFDFSLIDFDLKNEKVSVDVDIKSKENYSLFEIKNYSLPDLAENKRINLNIDSVSDNFLESEYNTNIDIIKSMKRCTRCILPSTFPFIEFDNNGVCNYCNNHKKYKTLGLNELDKVLLPYIKENEGVDCLVAFSGGRDSSYGLHYIKKVLKMNPIAYSYDWGMISDIGRRNQSRMCGQLGVEHILVSADIGKKRNNIKKNVSAWLKKPSLGTIPLFMAGDKQYFYYAEKLRKLNNTEIVILCENMLEKTSFKTGFCGIKPNFDSGKTYKLSVVDNLNLVTFYLKEYLQNPAYLNSSMLDTITAYFSYYLMKHNFLNLFNYIKWDECEVNDVLKNEYDWEFSKDTDTSWRIGDGTAPFYNYIYYTVAGFTENDTLRSNQIREGVMKRNEALELVEKENRPRLGSIKWYLKTIDLDFKKTIEIINRIPKLYE